MLHITESQIKKLVNLERALPVFKRAYAECTKGGIYTGPRLVLPLIDSGSKGQWLTAVYPARDIFGTKFSSVFPGNLRRGLPAVSSSISLSSAKTGELLAVVEGNALTAIKTACSSAIATDLLAREDASTLAIIGSGLQAFDQVLAIMLVRDIQHVVVFDLDSARAEAFIGHLRAVEGFRARTSVAECADAAVSQADIVCTCTTSTRPVFAGRALRPGTHINAIGSYAPEMQEIDHETVLRSSCIVTEHVDGLWAAAGDILDPFEKGLISRSKVSGSVGDLLAGRIAGRRREDQITLYESVGSAVLDLAIAVEAYQLVQANDSQSPVYV